jgi:hypothetical protein
VVEFATRPRRARPPCVEADLEGCFARAASVRSTAFR